jgi:hypothetical protein
VTDQTTPLEKQGNEIELLSSSVKTNIKGRFLVENIFFEFNLTNLPIILS